MKKGFTLVELVVVITIIMVITALGVVNFAGINKRSRDSRRISDLKKVSIALEIYRQENGTYPASLSSLEDDDYIEAIPTDPKDFSYFYERGDDGDGNEYTYTYDAQMEDVGSTNGSYGSDCIGSCNYRVSNP